jgi:sugar lactone lactonase YvrE
MTGQRDKATAPDRLLWVDLWGGSLHATEPDTEDTKTVEVPGRPAPGRRRAGAEALFRVATGATGLPATRTELG